MGKSKKVILYIVVVIIFFLTIPEVIVRVLTPEQLARLSDFTSFGGILNHLLSLLIFLAVASVVLAIFAIALVRKIYRLLLQHRS